jgi:hypothetical protein
MKGKENNSSEGEEKFKNNKSVELIFFQMISQLISTIFQQNQSNTRLF